MHFVVKTLVPAAALPASLAVVFLGPGTEAVLSAAAVAAFAALLVICKAAIAAAVSRC